MANQFWQTLSIEAAFRTNERRTVGIDGRVHHHIVESIKLYIESKIYEVQCAAVTRAK
jgi:hypothetical protein